MDGEIDAERTGKLLPDLLDALSRSAAGLTLDLRAVTFCDCSGLNCLLLLRRRAVSQNKCLVIDAMSPAVARILDLTGTRTLLIP
ncbi:STAS domain-containing protein [Streptomyces flavofungini]|uniref:STAS domain-containing protein n=1 Tax=Streptomyces flavofungini TaxID=68200 RepID=UPI0034DF4A3A